MKSKGIVVIVLAVFGFLYVVWNVKYTIPSVHGAYMKYNSNAIFKEVSIDNVKTNSLSSTIPTQVQSNGSQLLATSAKLAVQSVPTSNQTVSVSINKNVKVATNSSIVPVKLSSNVTTTTSTDAVKPTKHLNSYERSLIEKEQRRDKYLKQFIDEQNNLYLYPSNSTKYIIVYPLVSGLGNNLGVLAEGLLMAMLTHRRLLCYFDMLLLMFSISLGIILSLFPTSIYELYL